MKWDKLLRFFLLLVFLVCGCTSKAPQEKKIVIWHWMTDRKDAFGQLASRYENETSLKVEFKLFFPPDLYSQKVIAAARAGNLPDVFGILGEKKTFASFVKAGHIMPLTSYMEKDSGEWKNRFYPQTLDVVIFKNANAYGAEAGIYGVPIDTTVMQFVYNKTLFREAGINPHGYPRTFEDFIKYAQKVKTALGVDGFVCGWGEGWLLNALATEWAINLMGEAKFFQTINGQIPYTDQEWIDVFSFFAQLKKSDILATNIATMTNKEAEDAFAKGKAALSFNGTWAVNVYAQLAPDLEYAFFSLPRVSGTQPMKIWGGAGSSFMVNSHSSRKDEAVKFLNWLTQKPQQEYLIEETSNLPAIRGCEESLPSVLQDLLLNFEMLTHPDTWPRNEDSRVIEVLNRGLQQIIVGLKGPREVAEEVQKTKERISRR
ncbi:MAG: extracellular solute-binding protein [Candidatus Omnitrophota bacterium]|nr:MAG: extracellular solute-binding protein [Candidatus Omnitrophota bacterium]